MPLFFRSRRDGPRPTRRWGSVLLAFLVFGAVLFVGWRARAKFAWWRKAAFDGRVVAKQARLRQHGDLVADPAAVEAPGRHQFFLTIAGKDGTQTHEVTVKVYRAVRPGDRVVKAAGTYGWRRVPATDAPPAAPPAGP